MTTLKDILQGGSRYINQLIRKEHTAQGHYLTGQSENSLDADIHGNEMDGLMVYYARFVNEGVPAASASYKQVPFLIKYFLQRGLGAKEAKAAAFATVTVWKKEGMSTQASKRFSQTGARQNFVEAAFAGHNAEIDEYFGNSFDHAVEETYRKEKSETI